MLRHGTRYHSNLKFRAPSLKASCARKAHLQSVFSSFSSRSIAKQCDFQNPFRRQPSVHDNVNVLQRLGPGPVRLHTSRVGIARHSSIHSVCADTYTVIYRQMPHDTESREASAAPRTPSDAGGVLVSETAPTSSESPSAIPSALARGDVKDSEDAKIEEDDRVVGASVERVVCIGDTHGNLAEMTSLWKNLERELGEEGLRTASVVFLGDYCDRGPDTKGLIDWFIKLQDERSSSSGGTHFICGNHDFGFASYLGKDALPASNGSDFDLDATRKAEWTRGYLEDDIEGGMHYQGRRWGGSGTYHAFSTFASYGVSMEFSADCREQLRKAVPASHKAFLKSLKWVHDERVSFSPGRIIAVHAGLDLTKRAEPQIEALHSRDLGADAIFEHGDPGRLAAMSGRGNVAPMHPDLTSKAILISGHHGYKKLDRDRIIVDTSAGSPTRGRPLEAVVLPERKVVACDMM